MGVHLTKLCSLNGAVQKRYVIQLLNLLAVPLICLSSPDLSAAALMGLPETSGFYSKETIINLSCDYFHPFADYAHTLLL